MSELEHALRAALADPPAELPRGVRDPLWDIEERIHRRRQKRRRRGLAAMACAAVAAVVVPLSVYGTPGAPQTASNNGSANSDSGNRPASAAGGGAVAVPPAVRTAAEKLARAPGSHADRIAEWLRTTVRRWDQLADTSSPGQANIAIYVVQLRGHFTCYECSYPFNGRAPRGVAQVVVVPVHKGQQYNGGFGPSTKPYNLSKLGTVHTFAVH